MTDLTQSKQYILSIRLSADGFSFAVCNPAEGKLITSAEADIDPSLPLTPNLKNSFREVEFLGLPYKQVYIIMTGKRFTTVPLEMFDEGQADTLFYYNHPQQENEIILTNRLKHSNIAVLFSMDKSAYDFLHGQYPEAKFYSQATLLLGQFAPKGQEESHRKMYATLRADAIDLICFDRNKLLLNNSLPCTETADRIYYLLYTWKQLEFDQEHDELYLAGHIPDKEKLAEELRRFVRHVSAMKPISDNELQSILTLCE